MTVAVGFNPRSSDEISIPKRQRRLNYLICCSIPMYIRDKRSPVPKNETVSRVMSANRPKNTKPELLLRKALWQAGARGYRLHRPVRTASGSDRVLSFRIPHSAFRLPHPAARTSPTVRPDISFVSKKIAIFVNGCYWHRCPKCNYPLPKTNTKFWQTKFETNIARDKRKELRHDTSIK